MSIHFLCFVVVLDNVGSGDIYFINYFFVLDKLGLSIVFRTQII